MPAPIPVVLFAYARPALLARVLEVLRENRVPLLWVFSDGARDATDAAAVGAVRARLRAVDWCDCRVVERPANLGLGRNVRSGVDAVAREHEAFIVWEDDLIAVPGTYAWMCAALHHYAADERVRSISAWTHPRVTPPGIGAAPYFDARADCWVWGTWARGWRGMTEETALAKLGRAAELGRPVEAYGADLLPMAQEETARNLWAVRWLCHHFADGGLCLRPPWSMVEHLGFDRDATNAGAATDWANPPLRPSPPIPTVWPEPTEHPACRDLWQAANPGGWRRLLRRIRARLARMR
jgi:hypothetical protein